MASQTSQAPAHDSQLIPVQPVLAAVLPELRAADWHMTRALSALPDPAPWPDLVSAIGGVMRPLAWRTEGLKAIELALDRLHRAGVIRIPGYAPAPDPEPEPARPGDYRPRCAWCGQPCPTLRSKYCKNSHRQLAYQARRKAEGLSPRPEPGSGRRPAPNAAAPKA